MAGGAQLSVPDMRRSTRHPVDFPVIGEHRVRGDVKLHICNVSAHGFMIDAAEEGTSGLARGDRVIARLPVIGRIEAYCIWTTDDRAGFQFEGSIRPDAVMTTIHERPPDPHLPRHS